jgi:hypothetical protein
MEKCVLDSFPVSAESIQSTVLVCSMSYPVLGCGPCVTAKSRQYSPLSKILSTSQVGRQVAHGTWHHQ